MLRLGAMRRLRWVAKNKYLTSSKSRQPEGLPEMIFTFQGQTWSQRAAFTFGAGGSYQLILPAQCYRGGVGQMALANESHILHSIF